MFRNCHFCDFKQQRCGDNIKGEKKKKGGGGGVANHKCTRKVGGTVVIDPKPIAELDGWSDGNVLSKLSGQQCIIIHC